MAAEDLGLYDIDLVRERLHEQIADKIQELIVTRELQPGDRLPPERELAKTLGVSRPTVREALRLLQHWGLVTMKPGSGTYVIKMGAAPIVRSVERFFSVTDCSSEDLIQIRALLEPEAAALAAVNKTPEDIKALKQTVEAMAQALQSRDREQLISADMEFHLAMVNASGNKLLAVMFASIYHLIRSSIQEGVENVFYDEGSIELHRMILDAILDGDPDRAREAIGSHLEVTRDIHVSK